MSGALEARDALDRISAHKMKLHEVTSGIFHAGREGRRWVDTPEYGVPFLGSTDILHADLSSLPLLSKKQIKLNPNFTLGSKWTLISRSGTIGRMAYVRPDMDGMACSEHVLRIVPDESQISPGYLYAYLSSKYGVPLVVSGTYGAIIQHIEPEHIANLPVPRLGKIELQIHDLVEQSATAIAKYSELLTQARQRVLDAIGLEDPTPLVWFESRGRIGWPEGEISSESLRAYNYDPRARAFIDHLSQLPNDPLGSLCDSNHFKGHIVFKRIESDPEHGYRLIGQREAFQMRPEGRWISRKSVAGLGLVVPSKTVLIPSYGTLGESELYCRAAFVTERTSIYAFSGDFYRCIPLPGKIRGGYLYAFLSTKVGFRILRSMSTGGKQQYQHPSMLARLPIPRLTEYEENKIADLVEEAARQYDHGLGCEDQARELVESAIGRAEQWQK
jgi:type I restriction enzyme S subunit